MDSSPQLYREDLRKCIAILLEIMLFYMVEYATYLPYKGGDGGTKNMPTLPFKNGGELIGWKQT